MLRATESQLRQLKTTVRW